MFDVVWSGELERRGKRHRLVCRSGSDRAPDVREGRVDRTRRPPGQLHAHGRLADIDLTTALCDPQGPEGARTCLAETASRRSTAEEREAAVAWLEEAARSEHQIALKPSAAKPPVAPQRVRDTDVRSPGFSRVRLAHAAWKLMREPDRMIPLDALQRQQQRILHRRALIDYVLAAERQRGQTLTLGDALADLLADITEARTTGPPLQTATERP